MHPISPLPKRTCQLHLHYIVYPFNIERQAWMLWIPTFLNFKSLGYISGVARVPSALGQEIFLRPLQQNLQSLN